MEEEKHEFSQRVPGQVQSLANGLREKIPSRIMDKNSMMRFVIFMLESLDQVLHHCVIC